MGGMTEVFLNIGAKVVCVEPQDVCIGVLQQKYGKNPNVALVKKGLASKKGEMTFYICEGAHTISTFSPKSGKQVDFQTISGLKLNVYQLPH